MAQFDNYLSCDQYTAAPDSEKYSGFKSWYHAATNAWYFAAVTNRGRVVLRSEAYTTESARDNGIESVMRNRDLEERYAVVQDENDKKWYVILMAGNRQEIARSCAYDNEAAARAGILASFSTYRETAADRITDNYLPCDQYAAAPDSQKYPGFKTWHNADNNAWYFAAVTDTGRVVLRSEAYTTESARDNGIESVMRNRDLEERYSVIQDETDRQWYTILKAGNHQEIARSCAYDSQTAARVGIAAAFSTYKEAVQPARTATTAAIIEDYLPCAAYAGKTPDQKNKNFTLFRDADTKLYYFAMVDKSGKVILKSEGYKSEEGRTNGIASVVRNRDIKDHWVKAQDDHGYYMSLLAGNRQEIARTCHFESEGGLLAWWTPFVAAGLGALGMAASDETAPVVPIVAPPVVPVVPATPPASGSRGAAPIVPPPPPITSYKEPAVSAAAGGSNWWKWLLPLLLLLGLLLLWRSCGGCQQPTTEKVSVEPPAVATEPVAQVPPASEPAKATTPVPAPAAAKCQCGTATDPVFRLGTGTPKSLSRLGTNPEFGNSHGLSPEEFYNKLSNRYKENPVDKRFLDRTFKAMGYTDGFVAARADLFSAVELQPGTVGNIGYSTGHKTLYARLDTQGKDLMAFRIKAANGCDLHFMKTCGNHFFFCEQ